MVESGLTLTLLLSFVLGIEHAFDADHVVAMSTILSNNKSLRKSSVLGVMWGIGHATTLFLAGLVVLALKIAIPSRIALLFEIVVGIMLVILGVLTLRKALSKRIHLHPHKHEEQVHIHYHSHKSTKSHNHAHKSLLVGMLHGLAGSAALMLLILSAMDSIIQGLAFILVFGIASVLGMLTMSTVIGLPLAFTTTHYEKIDKKIKGIIGLVSIGLGVSIVWKILGV